MTDKTQNQGDVKWYALVEDNVIVQKQPYPQDGFIEVPEDVVCGMVFNGSFFIDPLPSSEILEQSLSSFRYNYEIGGIEVFGVMVQTDRETRANLIGARIKAMESGDYTVTWKSNDGFIELNAAQIIVIADTVAAHVQRCFKAEAQVFGDLASYDNADDVRNAFLAAYDAIPNEFIGAQYRVLFEENGDIWTEAING